MTDIISVIDREAGGREALADIGVILHPLITASFILGRGR